MALIDGVGYGTTILIIPSRNYSQPLTSGRGILKPFQHLVAAV
jgi:hypothetical protein